MTSYLDGHARPITYTQHVHDVPIAPWTLVRFPSPQEWWISTKSINSISFLSSHSRKCSCPCHHHTERHSPDVQLRLDSRRSRLLLHAVEFCLEILLPSLVSCHIERAWIFSAYVYSIAQLHGQAWLSSVELRSRNPIAPRSDVTWNVPKRWRISFLRINADTNPCQFSAVVSPAGNIPRV